LVDCEPYVTDVTSQQQASDTRIQQLEQLLQQKEVELSDMQMKLSATECDFLRACTVHMSYDELENDANLLLHYTALPDSATFDCIIGFAARFEIAQLSWSVTSMSDEDQLLITLIKLRHNFTNKHLAFLFNLCPPAVTKITSKRIDVLHELLFVGVLQAVGIPSQHRNMTSMPDSFHTFPGEELPWTALKFSVQFQGRTCITSQQPTLITSSERHLKP